MPRFSHLSRLVARSFALVALTLLVPTAAHAQVSFAVVGPNGIHRRDACVTAKVGDHAAMECGDLRLTHTLPAFTTYGKSRAPTMIYTSEMASPKPVVHVNITVGATAPSTLQVWVINNGVLIGGPTVFPVTANSTQRVAVTLDVSALATDIYYPSVIVDRWFSGGSFETSYETFQLPVVNRTSSPFGAGWWVAGLEELKQSQYGTLLWIGGDGSAREYGATGYVYSAPNFDVRDSITYDPNTQQYTRWAPGGTRVVFNHDGLHIATIDRLGHETDFTYYSATRRLHEILLPAPSVTRPAYGFAYDGNAVLWYVASTPSPSGSSRSTVFWEDGGRITQIADPDEQLVQFGYGSGSSNVITSRTDRRGYTTSFSYDAINRLSQSSLTVGSQQITYALRPVESMALTAAQPLDSMYTRIDGPRTDVADFTKIWVNRFWAPTRIRFADGGETQLTYDSTWPALVSQIQRPNGFITTASYDGNGSVSDVTDVNPLGNSQNATTHYDWDSKWTRATQITRPLGDVVQFAYDANNGNMLWRQPGTDAARRDSLLYQTDGLLKVAIDALGLRDSVSYDTLKLRNLATTKTPRGYVTRHFADVIGRDTLVTTPTDSAPSDTLKRLKTYTVYDLMDRVLQVRTVGGSDSLVVNNVYDVEGHLASVSRHSYPDTNHLGWVTDAFVYDGAGRVTQKTGAKTITMRYDPAGNLVWTSRGDSTVYDAMNRPIQHLLPAVTADVSNSGWSMDEPDGAPAETETFSYNSTGQLITADNQYAQIRRGYYPNGALRGDTLKLREYGTTGFSTVVPLEYAYDLNRRRSKLKHQRVTLGTALSDSIQYTYHSQTGALQNVTDPQGSTFVYADNVAGQLASLTLPDASVDTWGYDQDGRMSSRNAIDVGVRDARGLVLSTYNSQASETHQFTYTLLGAVKQSLRGIGTSNARQEDFVPDAFGNTAKYELMGVGGDGSYKRVYDAGTGQILTSSRYQEDEPYAGQFKLDATYLYNTLGDQIESRHYTYVLGRDCVGQCVGNEPPSTDSTVQAQTYDANGRLRYVKATTRRHFLTTDSVGTATTEYRYDALGRRVLVRYRGPIACQYSGSSTACRNTLDHSVWDGNQLLSESREVAYGSSGSGTTGWDGDVVYTYGRELDVPLAMLRRSTTTGCTFRVFPHTDFLGRLASGTFPSGTPSCAHVDWPAANMRTYRYLAGSVAAPWNGSLVTLNGDESGLQYARNRYFDPATGQFTQEDPIGLAGGLNLYGFADGDPVNYSDPFGLCKNAKGEEVPPEQCDKPLVDVSAGTFAVASGVFGLVRGLISASIETIGAAFVEKEAAAVVTNSATKAAAREAIGGMNLPAAQAAAARSAVSRATASESIELIRQPSGDLMVHLTRPGRNGFQVVQSTISPNGVKSVTQYGVDVAGRVVVDPKLRP